MSLILCDYQVTLKAMLIVNTDFIDIINEYL